MVSRTYLTEFETKCIIHYDGYRLKLTVRISNTVLHTFTYYYLYVTNVRKRVTQVITF